MKVHYTQSALSALNTLPRPVRKALYRKVGFLLQDLRHPSLHAKKYDESKDLWQKAYHHFIFISGCMLI